jgi:Insecticidal Crystal Toxin, P42
MNPNYEKALKRQLVTQTGPAMFSGISFENRLPIAIRIQWINPQGVLVNFPNEPNKSEEFAPGRKQGDLQAWPGCFYHLTTSFSGAFVGLVEIQAGQAAYQITPMLMTRPNDIGPFPQPSKNTLIPVDSPRVLVACGKSPNGKIVAREQFWKRSSESYTLAPHQTHTIGFSVTNGMQETTSKQETVAQSLGMSASAGWGPVSASVSASLSATSTTFQQVTITKRDTRYETVVLTNNTDKPQTFLKWQLLDLITIFEAQTPTATIVLGQSPTLIGGPY